MRPLQALAGPGSDSRVYTIQKKGRRFGLTGIIHSQMNSGGIIHSQQMNSAHTSPPTCSSYMPNCRTLMLNLLGGQVPLFSYEQ